MAETFTSFLLELAESPRTLAAFHADPGTAMRDAGLSEVEQAVITSRDTGRIAGAVRSELAGLDPVGPLAAVWVVVLVSVASSSLTAGDTSRPGGDLIGRLRALGTTPGR